MSKDAIIARYKSWYGHYVNCGASGAEPTVWVDTGRRKVARQNYLWRKQYVERRKNS